MTTSGNRSLEVELVDGVVGRLRLRRTERIDRRLGGERVENLVDRRRDVAGKARAPDGLEQCTRSDVRCEVLGPGSFGAVPAQDGSGEHIPHHSEHAFV